MSSSLAVRRVRAHRPAGHGRRQKERALTAARTAFRRGRHQLSLVSGQRPDPLRSGHVPTGQAMARPAGAGLPAGTGGSGPAGHSRSEDGTRLDSRRRRVPARRGARGALPEPGTARQRRAVDDPAGCRRRYLRGAGLPLAVVAAALAARRCARLSLAGGVLNFRDRRGAPRADLSRRAPQPSARAARRCAVDPVRPGLRRLQSHDRPLSVVLVVIPLVLAATAWGMFVRARRQLLFTLRERALRAEAEQRLHADTARMAERTLIAREMHDVRARPPDLADGAARRVPWRSSPTCRPRSGRPLNCCA